MHFTFQTIMSAPLFLGSALALSAVHADTARADCKDLPESCALKTALQTVVAGGDNAGLSNEMWATIVDRDGIVCQVAFTAGERGDQWPGSRVISAQKANTANAFSLPGVPTRASAARCPAAICTERCWSRAACSAFSSPIRSTRPWRTRARPRSSASPTIPMTGKPIGGVNVFGGGLLCTTAASCSAGWA